jgi:hypothetical protein
MSPRHSLAPAVLFALLLPVALSACGDDDVTPPPITDGGVDLGADLDADVDSGSLPSDGGTLPTTSPGYEPGPPITATPGDWTWVDFPDSKCQDGSPTGIGVNPSATGSDRLVIYLEGGGACFNETTCGTVANPNGFGEANFAGGPGGGIFRRSDATNPFADWNMVYVPYCTGDIFAGNNPIPQTIAGIEKVFLGYVNMGQFLNRVVPTFPAMSMVVLTGESAGGFGASYNYQRTQDAFGTVPVHLIDDSGPIMSSTYLRPCMQDLLRDTWNLDATLPPDCTECFTRGTGLSAALPHVIATHPDRRFALLSATRDNVIRFFMGFGLSADCSYADNFTGANYTAGLLELRDATLGGASNFHSWYIDSSDHTWLNRDAAGYTAPGTPAVPLRTFIQQLIDDDPAWSNVGP